MSVNCEKMAVLMKKGKIHQVGDFIDPIFKKCLEKYGIFLETIAGQYILEKIVKLKIVGQNKRVK